MTTSTINCPAWCERSTMSPEDHGDNHERTVGSLALYQVIGETAGVIWGDAPHEQTSDPVRLRELAADFLQAADELEAAQR